MRAEEIKKLTLLLLGAGLFVGILYVNIFAKDYVTTMGMFSDFFLEQFGEIQIDKLSYFKYITEMRAVPLLIVCVFACTKYRKIFSGLFLLWTGFAAGMMLTASVFKMNVKGILLCLVAMTPHFICYAAAYSVLFIYIFSYPNSRWHTSKTVFIFILMILGIVSECFLNPGLLHMCINVL